MIRRLSPPLALLCAVIATASATHATARAGASPYVAPQGSGALFLVTGHGWGHGVGMGQWGAEGYALHGWTYDKILAAYYPGTELTETTARRIRVLLADGQSRLTVSSKEPIAVVDGNGAAHEFPAGDTHLTTALPYPPPLTLTPTTGETLTLGNAYRGRLVITKAGGKLRAINDVPLEQYVQSVVPAEVSSSWKPDALKAQAVATRSYALAGRRANVPWDVSVSGQAYLGITHETPEGNAAVKATKGEVLTYDGKVATTVYSSSTGGWTQSASDAWGGSAPYLISVKDPYDTVSPWHDWGPTVLTGAGLATTFGIPGKAFDATVKRNDSKRALQLVVTMRMHGKESDASIPATTVVGDLILRSNFFDVGVLYLAAPSPNPAVPAGTTVTLGGTVRGVKKVVLQQRPEGGSWSEIGEVSGDPKTGELSVDVAPAVTTQYRLASARGITAWVRVRVSSPS